MKYGVLKQLMEGRFVMLLFGFWCSKTGEDGGVGGEVIKPIRRGMRDGETGFGNEAIAAHVS